LDWKLGENKPNLLAFGVLRSADSVRMRKSNLKKQSQFAGRQNDVIIFITKTYGFFRRLKTEKTKPIYKGAE
jgi:hypothetical protein